MPLQQVRRLEYAGPYVPKYKPLPSTVKLLYGTAPVVGKLSDDAEEAVVNYGRLLEAKNKHIRKRTFNQNFFNVINHKPCHTLCSELTRHNRVIRTFGPYSHHVNGTKSVNFES